MCKPLTSSVDILLTRVPDARVKMPKEKAIVPSFPAIVNFARVRLVHPIVDAIVPPLLAAVGFGDPLCPFAPIGRDERRSREEKSQQIQTHGEQSATFSSGLHSPS